MSKPNPIFFIPGAVPSLKNTKQVTAMGGKPRMFNCKRVVQYLQLTDPIYEAKAEKFYSGYENGRDMLGEPMYAYPVKVGFHFIRADARRFDFHNATHIVADQMVKHNWIPDDDMNHFLPFPLYYTPKIFNFNCGYYSIRNDKPGVLIRILGNNIK